MVTRNEGYRRGAGKEQMSLAVLRGFLQEKIGCAGEEISGPDDNYRSGDLVFPSGRTVECKGQPIDPDRYSQNFVEVFEQTSNDRHLGGFARVAELLDITTAELARASVRFRGRSVHVGEPDRVSVSITSIAAASFTAYVNHTDGGKHIYVYERDELMSHIRSGVRKGMVRGAGNSNEDTFAVFVPLARMRWTRRDGKWVPGGEEKEPGSLRRLTACLL
ncbi:MAG: hypothetical protein RLZZ305_89 [Actinomycetota bacterium]|jgi:hypothetical protein